MKRPFGVLVIAIASWIVSVPLFLAAIAATRSPEKIEGAAGFWFFMVALCVAIGVGLFRLNYWARIALLVLTAVALVVSLLGVLGYITMPLAGSFLGRAIPLSTVLFWLIAGCTVWYLNRPSVKRAFDSANI